MKRSKRAVSVLLMAIMAIGWAIARAEEMRKRPTLGEIWFGDAAESEPYRQAFREGLEQLSYREGENVTIITRYAHGDAARFPSLVNEMIARDVDAMLITPAAVPVAVKATQAIPIVCAVLADPVRGGLVRDLAHPGGNLTGLSTQGLETDAKRLELATDLVPNLKRSALLFDANTPGEQDNASRLRVLAQSLGVTMRTFGVRSAAEIETVLDAIRKDRPQVLIVFASPLFTLNRAKIFGSTSLWVPVISEGIEYAEAGALITFAPNWKDMFQRSATYIDKIIKGAKAGDLPIEQPTKFELVVNLRTAKALRVQVSESILLRADRIIR